MTRKAPPLTSKELVEAKRLYLDEGWPLKRVGNAFGRSHGSMHYILTQAGITLRSKGRPQDDTPGKLSEDAMWLCEHLYITVGWSLQRIAFTLNTHGPIVRDVLKLRNVTLRVGHVGDSISDEEAIRMVNDAIKCGDLKRDCCEQCHCPPFDKRGHVKVIAHHDDYNFPLVVRWLCHSDHRQWHQRHQAIPKIKLMPWKL